jgi:hypothetical protein
VHHRYQLHPEANLPPVSTTPAVYFGTGTAGVVDTVGKLATSVKDTSGKFAAGVNDSLMNCGVAFVIIFRAAI